jgi:putative methyltransferase
LHLPVLKEADSTISKPQKKGSKVADPNSETRKRKREEHEDTMEVMVDDDGEVTAVNSEDELKVRIDALSKFQLELLLHAFKFPAVKKITYSTCSVHAGENELVVEKALEHPIAKERGWRILKREDQIRGMQEWPVRGSLDAFNGDEMLAEACIRANKGDEHCTMGFFLVGFTRDRTPKKDMDAEFLRDERGHLVRDLMGFPSRAVPDEALLDPVSEDVDAALVSGSPVGEEEEGWAGFGDDDTGIGEHDESSPLPENPPRHDQKSRDGGRHEATRKRPQLHVVKDKKRKKSKK